MSGGFHTLRLAALSGQPQQHAPRDQRLRQLHHLLHLRPQVQEDLPWSVVQSGAGQGSPGGAHPLPQSTQGQQTDRQMVRQTNTEHEPETKRKKK